MGSAFVVLALWEHRAQGQYLPLVLDQGMNFGGKGQDKGKPVASAKQRPTKRMRDKLKK